MKICNFISDGCTHPAVVTEKGIVDVAAAGFTIDEIIAGRGREEIERLAEQAESYVEKIEYANVVNKVGKLVCVGLNYLEHARRTGATPATTPILFSKFANSLAANNSEVVLPKWENSYDYEAELVIVIGKKTWNVSEDEAEEHIFGYTCGNDISCRDAQKRTKQWLIGKAMPGFGPCGPCIVTSDSFDPEKPHRVQSYVNGELRQDGTTDDMIFTCKRIVSYASKYIELDPGDLIFTGTPSGVALEGGYPWLKPGDVVDVCIEGIGTLTNKMV